MLVLLALKKNLPTKNYVNFLRDGTIETDPHPSKMEKQIPLTFYEGTQY